MQISLGALFSHLYFCFPIWLLCFLGISCTEKSQVEGLQGKVEVIRDKNGINHIYAGNEHDLFFTQGYLAAKDRLFQFELWRRQATGTVAEIFGERELGRDIGARLFGFRGDKELELNHYHPRGILIVDAFVEGINTYIKEALLQPEELPVEFAMLGILPQEWTWEVVISRHQGLLQNAQQELNISRIVSLIGADKAKELFHFHPFDPDLTLPTIASEGLLFRDIIAPYNAFRAPITFLPEDIAPDFRNDDTTLHAVSGTPLDMSIEITEAASIVSNNWVVSGELNENGFPIMANDPHRAQSVPSLRYWVGLHAPGWDVVGGGEPTIPGVSIGHNGVGAWGLTIFQTDMEDLRIYELHPDKPYTYRYQNQWLTMERIADTLKVKDRQDTVVYHYYTIHGPVTFMDDSLKKAVAIECAWMKTGGAPYLASLRMGQAQTWEEFREACAYNHVPAENMVWADKYGNIGWQATGISPIRRAHSGLVVSLGNGLEDWDGFLPILERPTLINPKQGFIVTANENLTDRSYKYPEAIGYTWADPFRGERIREVLASGKKFSPSDMGALQNDYLSLPARNLIAILDTLNIDGSSSLKKAKLFLTSWDYTLAPESAPAALYVSWERKIRQKVGEIMIPSEIKPYLSEISMTKTLEWLNDRNSKLAGTTDISTLMLSALSEASSELENEFGTDWEAWRYGHEKFKHALIQHPLGKVVSETWRQKLELGPVPRGGYSFTPSANAYGNNNTTGASFRIIVDMGDLESTLGANNPGQSGRYDSPFYKNQFELWWKDQFFTVPFSKRNVANKAYSQMILVPPKR